MRAALYLRVSTDERSASLDAQESGARAWCAREGHSVVATYTDEGISGAEWSRRPGVQALQDAADATPRPFDLVVVRDLDRLGRDAIRLPLLLDDLQSAGVRVVEWTTGKIAELEGEALVLVQLRAYAAAAERKAIARRTRTALRQKAERGQVTGGRVYGYRNVRGPAGVRYEVDPAEAAAVREMYERHAAGESARAIARSLTARGVPAPRGAPSWAPTTVGAILRSERYRGLARWGEVGAEYRRGTRRATEGADVVTYEVPAIVTPEQWTAAQARSAPARAAQERPARLSREPRYLLVGHAVCDHCGGPLASWRQTYGSGPMAAGGRRVAQTYRCGWHVQRGPETCPQTYQRPMLPLDRGVVASLAAALDAGRVRAAVARARELLRPEAADARRDEAEALVRAAERRVRNLTAAMAAGGGDVPELVAALRAASGELARERAALAALTRPSPGVDLAAERVLVARAADVRAEMLGALDDAHGGDLDAMRDLRTMLAGALPRPLRAHWTGEVLEMRGTVCPAPLLGWEGAGHTGREDDPNGAWTHPVFCAG